jgi:hypothetical protein
MNNEQAAEAIANLNYRLNLLSSEMTLLMENLRMMVQPQQANDKTES